jgi:hypothetical protein
MAHRLTSIAALTFSLFLVGCEAVPTQEGTDLPQEVSGDQAENTNKPGSNQPPSNGADTNAPPSVPSSSQVEYLSGQLLTLQEQVIQIKADTQELRQNAQLLLARMQLMNGQGSIPNSASANDQNSEAPAINEASVNRLVQDVGTLLDQTSSSFELVSSYTAKGQWVLIRYDRFTGETWLADQNRWNALGEAGSLPRSVYEVQIQRADKDIKGYVAARVDKRSGQTWWLREETWQSYQ